MGKDYNSHKDETRTVKCSFFFPPLLFSFWFTLSYLNKPEDKQEDVGAVLGAGAG